MIHHYNYHFLFLKYLVLAECHFSSDILVPLPELSNLCNHETILLSAGFQDFFQKRKQKPSRMTRTGPRLPTNMLALASDI